MTQLTTFYAYEPKWSPDGTKILFYGSSYGHMDSGLYLINNNGSGLRKVCDRGDVPQCLSDGTKIIYKKSNKLWIINTDGSNEKKLADNVDNFLCAKDNKIYFSDRKNIFSINSDGSGLKQITNNTGPLYNSDPIFSGDYDKILYEEIDEYINGRGDVSIKIIDLSGKHLYTLHTSTYEYWSNFCFAPHKTKILFNKYSNFGSKIYSINYDGTQQTELAEGFRAKWSNDTTKIAYLNNSGMYIMNSDGTNKVQITTFTHYTHSDDTFSWSKDDTMIVFNYNRNIYIVETNFPYNITQLTFDGLLDVYENSLMFSPDKAKIIFTVYNGSSYRDVYIMDSDGSNRTKLIEGILSWRRQINWLEKTNRIYYIGKNYGIYSILPDGTDKRLESKYIVADFAISPEGDIIYSSGFDIFRVTPSEEPLEIELTKPPKQGDVKIIGGSSGQGTINPDKGEKAYIRFKSEEEGKFVCRIFTLTGEQIYEETKENMKEGYFEWIPKNIASGVYIVSVSGPGVKVNKKIIILR